MDDEWKDVQGYEPGHKQISWKEYEILLNKSLQEKQQPLIEVSFKEIEGRLTGFTEDYPEDETLTLIIKVDRKYNGLFKVGNVRLRLE